MSWKPELGLVDADRLVQPDAARHREAQHQPGERHARQDRPGPRSLSVSGSPRGAACRAGRTAPPRARSRGRREALPQHRGVFSGQGVPMGDPARLYPGSALGLARLGCPRGRGRPRFPEDLGDWLSSPTCRGRAGGDRAQLRAGVLTRGGVDHPPGRPQSALHMILEGEVAIGDRRRGPPRPVEGQLLRRGVGAPGRAGQRLDHRPDAA